MCAVVFATLAGPEIDFQRALAVSGAVGRYSSVFTVERVRSLSLWSPRFLLLSRARFEIVKQRAQRERRTREARASPWVLLRYGSASLEVRQTDGNKGEEAAKDESCVFIWDAPVCRGGSQRLIIATRDRLVQFSRESVYASLSDSVGFRLVKFLASRCYHRFHEHLIRRAAQLQHQARRNK